MSTLVNFDSHEVRIPDKKLITNSSINLYSIQEELYMIPRSEEKIPIFLYHCFP